MDNIMQYAALRKVANIFGSEYIKELSRQLIMHDKNASGDLLRSLNYRVVDELNQVWIKVEAAGYLKFVDSGRRPGKQPPVKAIRKWIDDRKIVPRDKKTGRFMTKNSLAFMIARSIGKKGIQPTRVITNSMTTIFKNKTMLLQKAAKEDLVKEVDRMLVGILKKK